MLYAIPSALVSILLLALMGAGIALGHRLGKARAQASTEAWREHVHSLQSAILALLALLLAFTFSLALQRFDDRSQAVVDEANAIGTALLRADLLPAPLRDEARTVIGRYLDARVGEAALRLPDTESRRQANAAAAEAQVALWSVGVRAAQAGSASMATFLFVQSVNELIDSFGRRNAALERHVPELVTTLLFALLLLAGATLGYTAGVSSHRPSMLTYVLVCVMAVLVFVVLDLDRPRRGVIQVDHGSLVGLRATLDAGPAGASPPAGRASGN
jgi:hypothetical protein